MRKTRIFTLVTVVLPSLALSVGPRFEIEQLQGAWWSDLSNETANFSIAGNEVWLDYDSAYHPCRIEGDILIFELGPTLGPVKNRIISLEGDRLVLEGVESKDKWTLTRTET